MAKPAKTHAFDPYRDDKTLCGLNLDKPGLLIRPPKTYPTCKRCWLSSRAARVQKIERALKKSVKAWEKQGAGL